MAEALCDGDRKGWGCSQAASHALSEVATARSAILKTENRLERTRLAREQLNGLPPKNGGAKSRDEIVIDLDLDDRIDAIEQALLRERKAFELAKSKLELLETYSRHKTTKLLHIEVERKHSDELVKEAMWERERSNQAKTEQQIAACTLVAPVDGPVVYGNGPGQMAGQSEIEVGALVLHRRKIITIPDLSRILVAVKLPESHVDKIGPNMKARIRVDAFPAELLTGTVRDVAPRPDRSDFSKSGIKVYPMHVQIDEPLPGLRPGMTALAEIPIDELDNVLSVPINAVLAYDGKYQVAVKQPDGGFEWRDVSLGLANDEQVEVWEGIKSGEKVIINPISLMSDLERQAKFGDPPRITLPKRSPIPAIPRKKQRGQG